MIWLITCVPKELFKNRTRIRYGLLNIVVNSKSGSSSLRLLLLKLNGIDTDAVINTNKSKRLTLSVDGVSTPKTGRQIKSLVRLDGLPPAYIASFDIF